MIEKITYSTLNEIQVEGERQCISTRVSPKFPQMATSSLFHMFRGVRWRVGCICKQYGVQIFTSFKINGRISKFNCGVRENTFQLWCFHWSRHVLRCIYLQYIPYILFYFGLSNIFTFKHETHLNIIQWFIQTSRAKTLRQSLLLIEHNINHYMLIVNLLN